MTRTSRPALPDQTQTAVVVRSRRRCCLCLYLEGLDKPRKGQVAHLNRKNDDHRFDNLVWLCFDHHDEYDSRTSQSKGLKASEVRHYRDLLIRRFEGPDAQWPKHVPETARDEPDAKAAAGWRFPLWLVEDRLDLFAYEANQNGVCLIERIDLPDGRVVICCIEADGNPGSSITNSAERIATQVCARFDIAADNLVWLEHYPHVSPQEWDWVQFSHDPETGVFSGPKWTPMDADLWRSLRLRPKARLQRDGHTLRSKLTKGFPTSGEIWL